VTGLYAQSLHREHRGEWDFDLTWKPLESQPVYAGWLRAVRRGHARVHRGVEVGAPVLVLTSASSAAPQEWDDTVTSADIVLDVEQIRRWAHKLGEHVTLARVPGALHDVTLSARPVRERVFETIGRWLGAFVHQAG
jgi:alpha-beta hydrolase superfamily lysophospholipase